MSSISQSQPHMPSAQPSSLSCADLLLKIEIPYQSPTYVDVFPKTFEMKQSSLNARVSDQRLADLDISKRPYDIQIPHYVQPHPYNAV